jgi:hypothetical protein
VVSHSASQRLNEKVVVEEVADILAGEYRDPRSEDLLYV